MKGSRTALLACVLVMAGGACAYKVVQGRRVSVDAVEQLLKTVEKLRRLQATAPLRVAFEGPRRLRAVSESDLHRVSYLRDMEELSVAWSKVGLIPPSTDLAQAYSSVGTEAPAGYYDTSDAILRIVDRQNPRSELVEIAGFIRRRDLVDGEVLAHEVTHALQDMHFNLDRFLGEAPNDDAALARRCLAEGDASFVGYAYSSVFTPSMESWLKFVESRSSALDVKDAPDFVNRRFQLPYIQGARFVALLHKQGGWDAVNAAYADPPASTEEILHPDLYLKGRDRPLDVRLPAMDRFLGEEWRKLWENTVGELGLRTVFGRERPAHLRKREPIPLDAARGWDGDRAAVHQKNGTLVLTWKLAFDDEKEAREGFDAYRDMVGRYPAFRVIDEKPGRLNASSLGTGVWVERRGIVVVALEGFPLDTQEQAAEAVFAEPNGHAFDAPGGGVLDGGVVEVDVVEVDAGSDGGASP